MGRSSIYLAAIVRGLQRQFRARFACLISMKTRSPTRKRSNTRSARLSLICRRRAYRPLAQAFCRLTSEQRPGGGGPASTITRLRRDVRDSHVSSVAQSSFVRHRLYRHSRHQVGRACHQLLHQHTTAPAVNRRWADTRVWGSA
jgi:hypothetical protein